jgi:hypothetical protein
MAYDYKNIDYSKLINISVHGSEAFKMGDIEENLRPFENNEDKRTNMETRDGLNVHVLVSQQDFELHFANDVDDPMVTDPKNPNNNVQENKKSINITKHILSVFPSVTVNVEGSADINNNSTYNADLAKRRADKVVQILETGPKPVKPEQIIKTSTGETNSTQTNESEKYKDRKVTIEINYPKKCE